MKLQKENTGTLYRQFQIPFNKRVEFLLPGQNIFEIVARNRPDREQKPAFISWIFLRIRTCRGRFRNPNYPVRLIASRERKDTEQAVDKRRTVRIVVHFENKRIQFPLGRVLHGAIVAA